MLLLTPAQPPVQLAPSPRSTACRFMVCKHHEFILFFFNCLFAYKGYRLYRCWLNVVSMGERVKVIKTVKSFSYLIFLMTHHSPAFLTSVRPSIRRTEGGADEVTVIKGGDVTLQCDAEGVPRPAVTWLKDGRPITGQHGAKVLNEGRLLQIEDAKVSDTGRYTCIAVNVAGQADSKHDISVHGMKQELLSEIKVFCVFIMIKEIIFVSIYLLFSHLQSHQV